MTKIDLEIHEDSVAVINKIKNINDSGIELVIPEGSVLFDNILNIKLIKKYSDRLGIATQFTTDDQIGNTLLEMLDEREGSPVVTGVLGENDEEIALPTEARKPRTKLKLPHINIKLPKVHWGAMIIPLVLLAVGLTYLFVVNKISRATAKIVVGTDPLVRSMTVKVSVSQPTSVEGKILSGVTISTTIENTDVIETTGEKLVGKKAKGEVILYNMTDEDIEFKKGSKIAYEENDDIYYLTNDTVTVPAETLNLEGTGSIFGEASVEVTAADIGEDYNINKDSDMEVTGYKSSQMNAKSKVDFSGGKSEKVKVVSEDDKKALSLKLLGVNTQESTPSLEKVVKNGQKLISGSTSISISAETYSHKVGDETDKLQLSQMVTVKGLAYETSDLDKLIEKLADNLIPEGYKPSDQAKEIKAEVLGNVSAAQEAEIQATVKTYIVPDIDIEKIKESLLGKSAEDGQKIIGSLRNIRTYEFEITPGLPLFKKVPKDPARVSISVEVE